MVKRCMFGVHFSEPYRCWNVLQNVMSFSSALVILKTLLQAEVEESMPGKNNPAVVGTFPCRVYKEKIQVQFLNWSAVKEELLVQFFVEILPICGGTCTLLTVYWISSNLSDDVKSPRDFQIFIIMLTTSNRLCITSTQWYLTISKYGRRRHSE